MVDHMVFDDHPLKPGNYKEIIPNRFIEIQGLNYFQAQYRHYTIVTNINFY